MLRTFWASPATLLGLVIAVLTGAFRGGRCAIRSGVLEVHSPGIRRALRHLPGTGGFVSAMTLGHVVIGVDAQALERTRDHERVHVRQYERWGPFFIPAYALASLWALMRGGHAYWDNPFERDAYRAELANRCGAGAITSA